MKTPKLYRRRYIPNEIIHLSEDKVVLADEKYIVTKWNTLKPRKDFTHGMSCYFLNRGFKVSKFLDSNENILFWYCDIIDYEYNEAENSFIFNDLLIDVIVYEDGFVKVLDIEEIPIALDKGLIDIEKAKKALILVNELLSVIYAGEFHTLTEYLQN